MLKLTRSAADLGLVLAAGGVPSLLFGPWGGTIADRVDLRRLLIGTQLAYGLLAGLLWALAVAGKASVPVIVAISVAGGVVQIADSPARQAFVGALVTPEDLSSAVSLNGVVMNSARVVGPAIAGVLIVTVGTTPCRLARRRPDRPPAPQVPGRRRAGVRHLPGRDGGGAQCRCRLRDAAGHGGGGVLVRDSVLDHAAAALLG